MSDYDPKLKKAMAEIKEIIQRYDIGAAVALVSKTHSEYMNGFPTWSKIQHSKGGLNFDFRKKSFKNKEEQYKATKESLHCLLQLRDICGQTFMLYQNSYEGMQAKIPQLEVDHEPLANHTPHDPNWRKKH